MRKTYRSEQSAAIHKTAEDLLSVGAITKATMRTFDADHLAMADYDSVQIRHLREANNMSQPVFAAYLGTTKGAVVQWESGARKPNGSAMMLLRLLERHGVASLFGEPERDAHRNVS